jgi:hypothetical protein
MKIAALVCCVILVLALPTRAEIEKIAQACDSGICFYWWPKLPELKGWHQDEGSSFNYSANALAPDGATFANAETIMYASALYKPRMPETKSVQMLIADDKEEFLSHDRTLTITESAPLMTGDGQELRSFTFFPKSKGNWEQVSYGEEGDFFLVFTISSHSKAGFERTLPTYRELIASYKEKLDTKSESASRQ